MGIEYSLILNEAKASMKTNEALMLLDSLADTPPTTDAPFATLSAIFKFGFKKVFPLTEIFETVLIFIVIYFFINILKDIFKSSAALNALKYFLSVSTAISLVLPTYKLISNAAAYMRDISTFIGVIFPIFSALFASGGNISLAKSYNIIYSA